MSEEEFRAERLYLMSLSVAKSMLKKGVISEGEFSQIDSFAKWYANAVGICKIR